MKTVRVWVKQRNVTTVSFITGTMPEDFRGDSDCYRVLYTGRLCVMFNDVFHPYQQTNPSCCGWLDFDYACKQQRMLCWKEKVKCDRCDYQCKILDVLGQMAKKQATKSKEPEKIRLGNLTYTDLDALEEAERPTFTFQQIIERAEASQKRKFQQMNVPAPPKRIINTPRILQHAKGPILDADSEKAKIISNQPFVCLEQKDKDAAEKN